jgi:hypothetical protein
MIVLRQYYRFIGSFLLIVLWFIFLALTTHSQEYYLLRNAKCVVPGEIISWRNDESKLVLSGWSSPEKEFRWSQNRNLDIWFKPKKELFQQSNSNVELSVIIEIEPIPQLEGKEIQFSLSPNGGTGVATLIHGRSFYMISTQVKSLPDILHLKILLPVNGKGNPGDPRDLGLKLYSVAFR